MFVDNLRELRHVLGEGILSPGKTIVNSTEFEQMLRESAPAVVVPARLDAHEDRILAESRERRRRRGRLTLASIGMSVVLIGSGSAAMAGFGVQTPWGWVAENVFEIAPTDGARCYQGMRIDPDPGAEDSAIVRDARAILSSIDIAAVAA